MSRDDHLAEVRHMAERMAEGMARAGEQLREIAEGLTRNLPRPEPTDPHSSDCCCASCMDSVTAAGVTQWDGTPASDPIGTVRVHPDDDPEDEGAIRYVLVNTDSYYCWHPLTGGQGDALLTDKEVTDWPRQHWSDVARVLGHEDATDVPALRGELKRFQLGAERLERERDEALAASERMEREHDELRHRAERAEARPASEPMMTMRGLACPTCRQPWMGEADHA